MFSSNNNDSSIAPDTSTHQSFATSTRAHEKSGRVLDMSLLNKDKEGGDLDDDSETVMSMDTTIDVASIDIFSLARHGRFQQLKQVLELGVDPNSKDKFGNTLLLIAA